jgi:hypothetical protein
MSRDAEAPTVGTTARPDAAARRQLGPVGW